MDTERSKHLPLKKRRRYAVETPNLAITQNCFDTQYSPLMSTSTIVKQHFPRDDVLQIHLPSPPLSPHHDIFRRHQTSFTFHSPRYVDSLPLPQPMFDFHTSRPRHYSTRDDPMEESIDAHFRKSLGEHYKCYSTGCLTPEHASLTNSPTEPAQTSIDEHFARSLSKFWPTSSGSTDEFSTFRTTSIVDDHFVKALGSAAWEKFRDKSH